MGEQLAQADQPTKDRTARVRGWDLLVLGLTACLGLGLSARWWDLPRWPVPVVQAGFPLLGIAAVVWAALLVLLRRRRPALAAGVVALVPLLLAGLTLPTSTVGARREDEVLLVANLEFGQADPRTLLDRVRALSVSTLVLVEVTPEAASRLRRAGLEDVLPHQVGSARYGAGGTLIRSRHRLTALDDTHAPPLFDQPVARVQRPAGAYVLRAVHTWPPERGLSQAWRRQLGALQRWRTTQPAGEPLVLAGDFNASHAHPGFRELADGFTDAHRAASGRWVRTWPLERRLPPFVQLDHVLVRRVGVVRAGLTTIPGTDHAAVWARLRIG